MRAQTDPDAALIDACRRGDCAAFGRIIERYQRAVYAVSYSSVRDRALSDDITQDTFVTAWRRIGDLRDTTRLPAWLCGIARNLARDAKKRARRDHTGDADELAAESTPFDAFSDAESDRLVTVALADVPEVYREALVLFYFEQQSIDDVARALGISTHTTNKRLSRGRQHLAANVDALLATKLPTRGPKRGLAACVVAAIGVLAPATPADASTHAPKGSVMPKLALATVLVATVGAVGILAAAPGSAKTSSPKASPTPASKQATTPSPSPAAPSKTPSTSPANAAGTSTTGTSSAGAAVRAPTTPALPPASVTTRVVPACDAVAQHMAQLQIDALDTHGMPADKRAQFVTLRGKDLSRRCTAEAWSDERRMCVMGADDDDSARVDCVEGIVATADDIAAGTPPALHCDVVAKHVATLAGAPNGKLALIAKKAGPKVDLAELVEQVRVAKAAECARIPWSLAVRRCLVAKTTSADTAACM